MSLCCRYCGSVLHVTVHQVLCQCFVMSEGCRSCVMSLCGSPYIKTLYVTILRILCECVVTPDCCIYCMCATCHCVSYPVSVFMSLCWGSSISLLYVTLLQILCECALFLFVVGHIIPVCCIPLRFRFLRPLVTCPFVTGSVSVCCHVNAADSASMCYTSCASGPVSVCLYFSM